MRVALSSRLACVLVVGVLIAGCDHKERRNDNPAQEAWTALSAQMATRLAGLRDRQKLLGERVGALAVPAGTEDVTLSTTIAELQGALVPADAAIANVETVMTQATADVTAQLAQRDKIAAERSVSAARTTFEVAVTAAEPALALLEPKVNAAEQIMRRLTAGIEAELAQLRRLATSGGNLDFSAIDFRAGSADFDFTHPASKATLDRLVQFAAACPQLRFGVTGHTSKEGVPARNKDLSQQRADAVKAYLVEQRVEAEKIVRTAGLGSTRTLVDEPDPGTPGEAAMDAATLEGLRRTNRRVTIDVVTPCATPAATAPPPGPPPTAPTAARPIAQPPH